jgi:hypothetical protein
MKPWHTRPGGHSTRAARSQNLSATVRGMRWQGKDTKGGLRWPYRSWNTRFLQTLHRNILAAERGAALHSIILGPLDVTAYTKKKGRLHCRKRPKSREETPKEGSDSGGATARSHLRRSRSAAQLNVG